MKKIVIIGSGPAGYTAALYGARAGHEVTLITSSFENGGALVNTTLVENYPGFPTGVMGPELMELFQAQAEHAGAKLVFDDCERVELLGERKVVHLGYEGMLEADAVILAMGAEHRHLGVSGEDRLWAHGVTSCATCDGPLFLGQPVAVIGGGDSACEEALYLSKLASSVTLLVRKPQLRASQVMQERVLATENITVLFEEEVAEFQGEETLESILLKSERLVEVAGAFVAIGRDPRSKLVEEAVLLDGERYVRVLPESTHCLQAEGEVLAGVFACGDLVDKHYQQAITAAGSGCKAALDADRYLSSLGVD